jgi:sialate O-acetylesterase
VAWQPPEVVEMTAEDGQIVLTMNTTVGAQKDSRMEGFAIAGEDRRFQPAKVDFFVVGKDSRNRPQFDRKKLVLSSSLVPQPVHYRYAWGRNPMGNLSTNGSGTPLPTQRSDSWAISEVPVEQDEALDHRAKLGRVRALLKEDDMKRRLHDAQTLLDTHSTSQQ